MDSGIATQPLLNDAQLAAGAVLAIEEQDEEYLTSLIQASEAGQGFPPELLAPFVAVVMGAGLVATGAGVATLAAGVLAPGAAVGAASAGVGLAIGGTAAIGAALMEAGSDLLGRGSGADPAPIGIASVSARGEEALKRGWFVVNSVKRLVAADDPLKQFEKEKRYFGMHQQMRKKRAHHANIRDHMATLLGLILGWNAVLDERTTPDCRAAHGKNFHVYRRPRIGFPGEPHMFCRCTPRAKWPDGQMLR
jgi:hypothetical protein